MLPNTFTGHVKSNLVTQGTVPGRRGSTAPSPTQPGLSIQLGGPNLTLATDVFNEINIVWDKSSPLIPPILQTSINGINSLFRNGDFPAGTNFATKFTFTVSKGNTRQNGDGVHILYIYGYNNPKNNSDQPGQSLTSTELNTYLFLETISPPTFPGVGTSTWQYWCPTTPQKYGGLIQPVTPPGQCPTAIIPDFPGYVGPNSNPVGVMLLKLVPGITGSNAQFGINDLNLDLDIEITISIPCTGKDLVTAGNVCNLLCQVKENQEVCFTPYLDYCFTKSGNETNIFKEDRCRNFFIDFNKTVRPKTELDKALNGYCKAKYPDPGGLNKILQANPIDQNLCGCHMQPEQYANFIKSLEDSLNLPSSTLGINERCLFTPCAASGFPTAVIGKICTVPKCLVISSINNNGTIGGVTVNQSANCANISKKTGSGGTGPPGSTGAPGDSGKNGLDGVVTNPYVWVITGGVVLLLIIIIVVIAVSSSKKSNKK